MIDTNPPTNFVGKLVANARLRALAGSSAIGAVLWVNAAYAASAFLAVSVTLVSTGPGQQVLLNNAPKGTLLTVPVSDQRFVQVSLLVDTAKSTATLWVDSVSRGTFTLTQQTAMNNDTLATVGSFGVQTEVDYAEFLWCQ